MHVRISGIKASYPEDEKSISGFITWLSFRRRPGGVILKELHFHLDDGTEVRENACKIVSAASIDSDCSLVLPLGCDFPRSRAEPFQLLSFATLVKELGNERFRRDDLDGAKELYVSALLATAEWEHVVRTQPHRSVWLRLCLDISSNMLQTCIQAREFRRVDETMDEAVKRVIKLASFDCIEKEKRVKAIKRVMTIVRKCPITAAMALDTAFQVFHEATNSYLALEGIFRLSGILKGVTFRAPGEPEPACSICLETVALDQDGKVPTLACLHYFHKKCITNWLVKQDTCPVCRRPSIQLDR
ncbi:MAG: hypothetical protein M1816_001178 [Peltula sp. TS41687]|nr:MAG: hypothetical protein M1816_001178 [Peltula sp. TS41687]